MIKRILFVITAFFAFESFAANRIDITKGNMDPLPIALGDLDGNVDSLGAQIIQVAAKDLENSGLFRIIPKDAFIEAPTSKQKPNFVSWRQINASALSTGSIETNGGNIDVTFRLWDVYGESQIAGKTFSANKNNWRRIAHKITDEIYKTMTGENGYFDTRIVFVSESGPANKRIKRLSIMDQDGANNKFLTDGKNLVLTPRFSPSMQQILYLSYANKTPRVYLRELETGREKLVGDFAGMSFAPRFSPDGKSVVMSIARDGATDLYTLDIHSMRQTKLTDAGTTINTSPSFSPDGEKIVFNSDRSGKPHLYVMSADGSNQERISFGDGIYGSPVWSPRGDLIAFTKIKGGQFYIGVMKADGSAERLITNGYLVEGQSWAPNGRVLVFTKQDRAGRGQTGKSKIYTIDLTGYNERELSTPQDASDPTWSPLL